jgi:hypothetical protein
MRGDFTRDTFEARKHFSRVLKQQGRVTLDADDNEQTSILLHYLRTLASDLLGPFAVAGGDAAAFSLANDGKGSLTLSKGHCYVDGILVENDHDPFKVHDELFKDREKDQGFWLYLDVWEGHVTPFEDPSIREVALGGPDTCTRAKVMWRVKALPVPGALDNEIEEWKALPDDHLNRDKRINELTTLRDQFEAFVNNPGDNTAPFPKLCAAPLTLLGRDSLPRLTAQLDPGERDPDPCSITSPDSKYRGLENQLYRVEIHHGGLADKATFKWSRDNGSIVTTLVGFEDNSLQVVSARGFAAKSWVEISPAARDPDGEPGDLVKVISVEGDTLSLDQSAKITLESVSNATVRRWDGPDGAVPIKEGSTDQDWITLENGIQVRFAEGGEYRPGDYWLIPARVVGGTIEWPDGEPLKPHGVEHHYAPLGLVRWKDNAFKIRGCTCEIQPMIDCSTVGAELTGAAPATAVRGAAPRSRAKRAGRVKP